MASGLCRDPIREESSSAHSSVDSASTKAEPPARPGTVHMQEANDRAGPLVLTVFFALRGAGGIVLPRRGVGALLCLLLAGDVELNPGPRQPRYPCSMCQRAVKILTRRSAVMSAAYGSITAVAVFHRIYTITFDETPELCMDMPKMRAPFLL